MKDRNVAFYTKEFAFENANVLVYIPDLTEEKTNKRKKELYKAARQLLKPSGRKRKETS